MATMRHTALLALVLLTAQPASADCSYTGPAVAGEYGGYTFYKGLLFQQDAETGKRLAANQAVNASHITECVQICLNNPACTGVTYRRSTHGQCLTYAAYDFETGRSMDLMLNYSSNYTSASALIRSGFQGPTCR